MRKVKLDTKSEKSAGSFFDNAPPHKNQAPSSAGRPKRLEIEKPEAFTKEHKSFIDLLKQAFIFLPGTFILFFMSFGSAIIFMEIIVYRRALKTLPDDFPFQFALIGLMIFLGIFMTWFGLGDLKNRKHLAIPVSVLFTGTAAGALVKAAANISDLADRMLDDFSYLIYLLPLALVVPIVAKGSADRKLEGG